MSAGSTKPAAERRGSGKPQSARPASRLDPDELADLEEQRSFLLTSLADLEREHDAGDLDAADYASLKDDYTARAAEVLRAIDQRRSARQAARSARRPGRAIAVVAAVAVVAVGAGLLVARSSGERRPGQTLSGQDVGAPRPGASAAPAQSPAAQQATACLQQFGQAEPVAVIRCFDSSLQTDPKDPTALTYKGWVLYQFGVQGDSDELKANGKEDLQSAVEVEPHSAEPHVFRAIIARNEGRVDDARAELAEVDRRGGVPTEMEPLLDQLRGSVGAP